ncbi:MAG: tetratricopeptide repeat protein [Candidatus Hinthialibacter antarcticus]|nr:tetratricopeptide repeat protein [Candidatus Hinthialibacter antarcticus]
MSNSSNQSLDPQILSMWERWVFLLGRLTLLLAFPVAVMVFYILTWRHYSVPKASLFQFLMMISGACWAVLALRRRFVRSALATPAAFLLSVICFSMLFAVNLGESYEIVTFKIACMVYLIFIPKFFTRFQDFTLIAYLLGLLCLAVDVYAIAQYYDWPWFFQMFESLGFSQMDGQPVSTMGNVNYTAEFLNIAVPILICMMIVYRRRAVEFLFFSFVTLLNSIVFYYLDCNASYAGFIVAIPLMLSILCYDRLIPIAVELRIIPTSLPTALRYFRYAVVTMILAIALIAVGITSFPNKVLNKVATTVSWVDTDGDNVTDGSTTIIFRLQCMDSAMRGIVQSLFTGIGPGNFKIIHPLYETQLERKVLGKEVLARKVHNDHLQHALKYGVFGLFAFYWLHAVVFFCIIYSLYHLRHRPRNAQSSSPILRLSAFERNFYFYLQLGILGGLTTSLVSCIFGHTFVIESSAVTYWMMSAIAVSIFQYLHRLNRGVTQPRYGFTQEQPNQVQTVGRRIPTLLTCAVAFALVLPFGAKNTYQLIGESWLKMGMGQRDSNKYETMLYCMNRALKIYPYQMESYYILGRYYIDAITEFAVAKGKGEQERIQYLTQRELYHDKEDMYIRKGIVCLQIDLFLNPNYKWAHNNLGVLYDRLNDFNLSKAAYGRVLAIDPEQIYAHFNLGLGMVKREQFADAITYMETSASLEPDYVEAYRYMASAFLIQGDINRAMASIDRLVSINLQRRLSTALGSVGGQRYMPILDHLNNGRLYEALSDAQRLMNYQDEQSQSFYLQSAVELIKQGQLGELTLEALNKGTLLAPLTDPPKLAYIASLYQNISQWQEAAKRYQQYLRLEPNDWNVRRNLANIYATLDDYPSAVLVFQKIVESGQGTYRDRISLARLMVGANQYTWGDILPHLHNAVTEGGDQAKDIIIENSQVNPLLGLVDQSEELQNLLGETYMAKFAQLKSQQ